MCNDIKVYSTITLPDVRPGGDYSHLPQLVCDGPRGAIDDRKKKTLCLWKDHGHERVAVVDGNRAHRVGVGLLRQPAMIYETRVEKVRVQQSAVTKPKSCGLALCSAINWMHPAIRSISREWATP